MKHPAAHRGRAHHESRPAHLAVWPQAHPVRRFARLMRPDGRWRVLPLLAADDPRLDIPTYLRRGLRIPGVNAEPA